MHQAMDANDNWVFWRREDVFSPQLYIILAGDKIRPNLKRIVHGTNL